MKKLLVLIFTLLCLSFYVSAENFSGYIVKIKEDTYENMTTISYFGDEMSLLSEMDDSEIVALIDEEFETVNDVSAEHLYLSVDDKETLDMLIELGVVERYEEDIYMELLSYDVTGNEAYTYQRWMYDCINADYAWNIGVYGNDVTVAVIDSGVYPNNDIANNLLKGYNYFKKEAGYDPSNTTDTSQNGHGTMVAGLIAAECNALSTVGLAFNAKIVPLRVTAGSNFSLSYAVSAIYDAVDVYDCDVLNLSFGSTGNSETLYKAICYAVDNDVIVVAASGNTGNKTVESVYNPIIYPAYYSEVVSVANASKSGNSYVVYQSSTYNVEVDIAAPGTEVYSLSNYASGYTYNTGTSFSCPLVSAAAALVKSIDPDMNQSEFMSLLKSTANSSYISSSNQTTNHWGAGLLDVEKMLKSVLKDKTVYVSDVFNIDNQNYFIVSNLTGTRIEACSVTLSEKKADGTVNTKILKVPLEAYASKEINLTTEGFTEKATFSASSAYTPGDVNGDGNINNRDASAILKHLSGYNVSIVISALDVNGDGKINNRDASAILKYLAGYEVVLH